MLSIADRKICRASAVYNLVVERTILKREVRGRA